MENIYTPYSTSLEQFINNVNALTAKNVETITK